MAKAYRDLFPQVYSFARLRRSFYAACKGKGNRDSIANFSIGLEENLHAISNSLKSGNYPFGPYRSFYVNEPKRRLIESACFPDRVVHHSIHSLLEPLFDPTFYEHSYACRSGRGHHSAMLKLHHWIKGNPNRYFLKCDIRRFFPSIDRMVLLKILGHTIHDSDMMKCLERLVLSAPGTEGIPIGNLTSQLFANLYLNELDQFVKRRLRIRHYIRYMDDFVLLIDSKDEAAQLRRTIEGFLNETLHLELSPQKVMIGSCSEGISFLGFFLKNSEIRLRGSFYRKLRKKIVMAGHKELIGNYKRGCPSPLQSALNSYAGHVRFCSNPKAVQEYLLEQSSILNGGADLLEL